MPTRAHGLRCDYYGIDIRIQARIGSTVDLMSELPCKFTRHVLTRKWVLFSARKWSIWIIFFLLNVILSGAMSFLLGRAVDFHIQVVVSLVITLSLILNFHFLFLQRQYQKYHEVIVSGDLSEDDLKQANNIEGAFDVIHQFFLPLSSQ